MREGDHLDQVAIAGPNPSHSIRRPCAQDPSKHYRTEPQIPTIPTRFVSDRIGSVRFDRHVRNVRIVPRKSFFRFDRYFQLFAHIQANRLAPLDSFHKLYGLRWRTLDLKSRNSNEDTHRK
ncbi:uncharacterized protein Dsimw501_GD28745 [Drosophila simulans]|uniref:Uncharacterized protein n=1 Tax=Drosophila simulans TaxID=7240 RepID=A0A0J9UKU3_DROSI|nr:uncharacterized protein Dsimw501_GD28745 [Drosophila simulans]